MDPAEFDRLRVSFDTLVRAMGAVGLTVRVTGLYASAWSRTGCQPLGWS